MTARRLYAGHELLKHRQNHGQMDIKPNDLPKTYGDMKPIDNFNFEALVQDTDLWTMGLCIVHINGICQDQMLHYLVAPKSDFTLHGFVCCIEYLAVAGDKRIPEVVRGLVNYLRTAIGWTSASTTCENVLARHKRLMRERNRKAKARMPFEYRLYAMSVFLKSTSFKKHKTSTKEVATHP